MASETWSRLDEEELERAEPVDIVCKPVKYYHAGCRPVYWEGDK